MYQTVPYIKAYYCYDRSKNTFTKFPTKEKLIEHIIRLCNYGYFGYRLQRIQRLNDLESNQNFTGNDTTVVHSSRSHYTSNNSDTLYIEYVSDVFTKCYTFYYEALDHTLRVFDIATLHEEIVAYRASSKPRQWARRHLAYQMKSHRRKPNKFALDIHADEDYYEYLSSASRRNLGYDDPYKYETWSRKWCKRSEKNWKTQSKKRRQYGNATRDKYAESDFFDVDDDLYLCK